MSKMTSPFSKLPLSFFYFFITLMPFHVISQSPATTADQTTLLNLKKLWQSPPWTASWNSSSSPCTWPEIQCTAGTVTGLLLRDKNIMGTIPPSICDLKNLTVLDLSYNYLQGDFPKVLYNCSGLQYLDLSQNFFVGSIPSDIDRLSSLRFINVGGNNFSGEIPPAISQLQELRTLHLYKNQFNGTVPIEIGNLANLVTLGMSYNTMLSPSIIPIEFGNLKKQEYLWMTMTNLIGKIPDSFANLSSLQHLDLAMNNLDGPLPQGLFQLKNLSVVHLSRNSLSGEIPNPIESNLIGLDMSMNNLSGQIPAIFGSLPDLLTLDLSENQFSGQIPPELGHLKLTNLNLSSNQFSGKISDEFDYLAYETSFLNNSKLCAKTPISNLPNCLTKNSKSNGSSPTILVVVLVFTVILFIATIILTVFMVRDYQRKKIKQDLAGWKLTSFQRFDFTKKIILSGLTENNLIGSGGSGKIYHIAVNNLGDCVAVKKIWNNGKSDHKLEKEFLAEVEILGTIWHSNIVKLLCCISSDDSKLLVYEYMEKQSLEKWLHGKKRTSSATALSSLVHHTVLDWATRLQIAVGAAQGLCYMHHDCSLPIIHRNVKSSNILLDSEFKAKIADFELAKILAKSDVPTSMSAVAGSIGYFAPEYAYTRKENEKIDVYSFGVVLLELVTGREPNDGDEHTSIVEWAWRQYEKGNSIAHTFDKDINESHYLKEMTTVDILGLACTVTQPFSRPSMKEVSQILRHCGPVEGSEGKKARREYDVAPHTFPTTGDRMKMMTM
ncbi:receptor-like protein kinase 5 [Camellia sinensis]|nr:receptor-like protein kinase 5 [Camellia sinensis]